MNYRLSIISLTSSESGLSHVVSEQEMTRAELAAISEELMQWNLVRFPAPFLIAADIERHIEDTSTPGC